jgi:hypothetical protein
VPAGGVAAGNFSEYSARMMSVATLGAGAASGSGSARYYTFEQGLTHFLVYTADAYTYSSGATFLANQLAFMKADLAKVDRARTPWVVGLVHKGAAPRAAGARRARARRSRYRRAAAATR